MSCSCQHCRKHRPDLRDGTGRMNRLLAALDPKNAKLDDRKLEDLLVQIKTYAGKIRFFPLPEEDDGSIVTWAEFLEQDLAVVLATVVLSDPAELEKDYLAYRQKLYEEPTEVSYAQLFEPIYTMAQQLQQWLAATTDENPLRDELELLIRSNLSMQLQKAIAYARGLVAMAPPQEEKLKKSLKILNLQISKTSVWGFDSNTLKADDSIYNSTPVDNETDNEPEEDISPLIEASFYIDDIFQTLYQAVLDIVAGSHEHLEFALEKYPKHQPHLALLIAFLELFKHLQEDLNDVTRRHLEFFYKDVLHLSERPAEPDRVHAIFELAKGINTYTVENGTPLLAGTEPVSGKDILYKTKQGSRGIAAPFVPNRAVVREIKNVYIERDAQTKTRIVDFHANPVANSIDGYGTPFLQPATSFDTFGVGGRDEEIQRTICNFLQPPGDFLNAARIGFAIASPQLLLSGGLRVIELKAKGIAEILKEVNETSLEQIFDIWLTGEKGWIRIPPVAPPKDAALDMWYEKVPAQSGNPDFIRILINVAAPQIIPFDPKLHPGDLFPTDAPVLKVEIKNLDAENFNSPPVYEDLVIDSELTLRAMVGEPYWPYPIIPSAPAANGLKDLLVQNAFQVVENGKTFFAFTQLPSNGAPLYVGSKEFFSKPVSKFKLNVAWKSATAPALGLSILQNKAWAPYKDSAQVPQWISPTSDGDTSTFTFAPPVSINRSVDFDISPYDGNNETGFFKVSFLENPGSVSASALKGLELQAEYISIEYDSILEFKDLTPGVDQFFHLYPFGFAPIFPAKNFGEILDLDALTGGLSVNAQVPETETQPKWYLFPQFQFGNPLDRVLLPDESHQYNQAELQTGHLIIGIEALTPEQGQNLSLLFKFEEGTQADDEGNPPAVHWSYLTNNEWRPLPIDAILNDDTFALQTTGIILFSLPKDMTAQNTLLPEGQFWLCASVSNNPDRFPRLISIQAQAVTAIFDDQNQDPGHYALPLDSGSIRGLKEKVDAVKSVKQPYESFGGRPADKGLSFYMEASERIRHKGRAVTVWDYEHLVLSHFPAVYKVKAIPVSDPDCICRKPAENPCRTEEELKTQAAVQACGEQLAPGHVMLVAIPDFRNRVGGNRLQPKNSNRVLKEIERELGRRTAPYVHIHAKNPVYEEVLVAFRVQFNEGIDKGTFLRQLNEELVQYLTPWAFEASVDVRFDGRVYASDVINFIEERPYVDFITDFRMFHCKDSCCAPEDELFTDVAGEVKGADNKGIVNPLANALIQVLDTNVQIQTDEYGKFKIPLADGDRISIKKDEFGTRILQYIKADNQLVEVIDRVPIEATNPAPGFHIVLEEISDPLQTEFTIEVKNAFTNSKITTGVKYQLEGEALEDLPQNGKLTTQMNAIVTISASGYTDKAIILGKQSLTVTLFPKQIDLDFQIKIAGGKTGQLIDKATVYLLGDESKQAEKQPDFGKYLFAGLEWGQVLVISAEGFMPRTILITEELKQLKDPTGDDPVTLYAEFELLPDCLHSLENTDELMEFWENVLHTYYPAMRGMELSIRPCTSRSILVSAAQHMIELYEPEPVPDPCAPPVPVPKKAPTKPGKKPYPKWPGGRVPWLNGEIATLNLQNDLNLFQQFYRKTRIYISLDLLIKNYRSTAIAKNLGTPQVGFTNRGFSVIIKNPKGLVTETYALDPLGRRNNLSAKTIFDTYNRAQPPLKPK